MTPFKTSKTRGVLCVVRIVQGPHAGRDVALRFLFEGPGHIVERDLRRSGEMAQACWSPACRRSRRRDRSSRPRLSGTKVILRLEHDKPWRGAVRAFAADVLVEDRESGT